MNSPTIITYLAALSVIFPVLWAWNGHAAPSAKGVLWAVASEKDIGGAAPKKAPNPFYGMTKDEKITAGFLGGMIVAGAFIWYVTRKDRKSPKTLLTELEAETEADSARAQKALEEYHAKGGTTLKQIKEELDLN